MARVQMDDEAPQIGRPVGSKEEVEELQIPTRNISTCSVRQDRENYGCPLWKFCDRSFRGNRPRYQVFRSIKKNGDERISHGPCFDVVQAELNATANGGMVEVLEEYQEGDTYVSRGSVKRHPKRDPNCNDCSDGKCVAYDDKEDVEFKVPVFPPAAEHRELRKYARAISARNRQSKQKKEAIKNRLLTNEDKGGKQAS